MVPHPMRIAFAVAATIANAILATIYIYAGIPLIERATVQHAGPFSGPVEFLYIIVPAVIGLLQLGIIIWLIVAPVQEQRSAQRIPR